MISGKASELQSKFFNHAMGQELGPRLHIEIIRGLLASKLANSRTTARRMSLKLRQDLHDGGGIFNTDYEMVILEVRDGVGLIFDVIEEMPYIKARIKE